MHQHVANPDDKETRVIRLRRVFSALAVSCLLAACSPGGPAADRLVRRRNGKAACDRKGAAVDRRRRSQGDDADARRRAPRDGHLPARRTRRRTVPIVFVRTPYNFNFWDVRNGVPADLTAALDGGEAGLRVRGAERARALLLGGQLRHPRRAHHRRRRRDRVAVEAAVVEREGRHDRLLVDRRVPVGHRGARASRVRGDERAGLRRRRRPREAVLRAGQLVPRRRRADALHRLALRRAEPGAADVPARHAAGGPGPRLAPVRSRPAACRRWTGRRRSGTCRSRTSSGTWTVRAASSPTRCRCRPAGG